MYKLVEGNTHLIVSHHNRCGILFMYQAVDSLETILEQMKEIYNYPIADKDYRIVKCNVFDYIYRFNLKNRIAQSIILDDYSIIEDE
jgi:hypothetical protein